MRLPDSLFSEVAEGIFKGKVEAFRRGKLDKEEVIESGVISFQEHLRIAMSTIRASKGRLRLISGEKK